MWPVGYTELRHLGRSAGRRHILRGGRFGMSAPVSYVVNGWLALMTGWILAASPALCAPGRSPPPGSALALAWLVRMPGAPTPARPSRSTSGPGSLARSRRRCRRTAPRPRGPSRPRCQPRSANRSVPSSPVSPTCPRPLWGWACSARAPTPRPWFSVGAGLHRRASCRPGRLADACRPSRRARRPRLSS